MNQNSSKHETGLCVVNLPTIFHSFGGIRIDYDESWIREIAICRDEIREITADFAMLPNHVQAVVDWFREYERGEFKYPDISRMHFLTGKTEFGRAVYSSLLAIPHGKILTYAELARLAGYAKAARAVGHLMAINRYPIVIPCHRVCGKTNPWLYAFGADVKRELLRHEGVEI